MIDFSKTFVYKGIEVQFDLKLNVRNDSGEILHLLRISTPKLKDGYYTEGTIKDSQLKSEIEFMEESIRLWVDTKEAGIVATEFNEKKAVKTLFEMGFKTDFDYSY